MKLDKLIHKILAMMWKNTIESERSRCLEHTQNLCFDSLTEWKRCKKKFLRGKATLKPVMSLVSFTIISKHFLNSNIEINGTSNLIEVKKEIILNSQGRHKRHE